MNTPLITIIGGSGFVGRHIVRLLCQKGYNIRVLCRDTVKAEFLKVSGNVGQVAIQHVDISRKGALNGMLNDSHAVIYLPGLLYQKGAQRFNRIHEKAAAAAAAEAEHIGAKHFIYMSALGVENSRAKYASTKLAGEEAVKAAFPDATILRPSLIIGPEDGFFQRFAQMNMIAPVLPLVAGGKTKFQPVYVEDVAKAVEACLRMPNVKGRIFELAGPTTYSFRELLELMGKATNTKASFAPLPKPLAMMIGFFSELLPFKPQITRDQVRNLSVDNVATNNHGTFNGLGIRPVHFETMLPALLKRFTKGA